MSLSPCAFQALYALLERHGGVPLAQVDRLASVCSERTFRKGETFLAAGEQASVAGLVISGLQGEFYLLPDGSRKAKWFARPGDVFGSLEDLARKGASRTHIEALSDGTVLCLPYAQLRDVALKDAGLTVFFIALIESLYRQKSEREYSLLMLNASERYEWFLNQFGSMAGLLSQELVASYLGISAVHLSRVRSARQQSTARR